MHIIHDDEEDGEVEGIRDGYGRVMEGPPAVHN